MHVSIVVKMVINHLNVQNQKRLVAVQVVAVVEVVVASIVAKRVIDHSNVRNQKKLVVENNRVCYSLMKTEQKTKENV
jgi:uncharacterized membrane protein (DUF106 family)